MSTAKVFDTYAERYDSWYSRNKVLAELELRLVKKATPQGYGIEIGVGSGFFASRVGVPLGLDPSIRMLEIAKMRGIDVVQGVGEALPLRSCSLDYALLVVTLCFVDNPLRVVEESARIVRRGGRVIACIIPADSPWGRHYIELGRRGHVFYSIARFYTVGEVEEFMEKAGLVVEDVEAIISTPPGVEPRLDEKPSRVVEGKGFVCVRAVKPSC